MNTNDFLRVAERFISNINEVQDNVYKGTLNVANKQAGVYYFDLNNQIFKDFAAYQENLLADEFYSKPGSLQWNYYLFLLNDHLNAKEKRDIEKNDKYARKYVLTDEEFKDFFVLEKSEATIRPDIVAEWKQRLDEVGLEDVYSDRSYADLAARFDGSDGTKPRRTQTRRIAEDSDKIRFINRLILKDNYRKYPAQRDFTFGKVNLFRGINGVGKTSLFEAIEAMICGKCLRNPKVVMQSGCIEAQINDSHNLISFDASNNSLYVDRDFNWYKTPIGRINTLYNSFNRFNFFNADAAHSFSKAETEKDASEALFSIILGPEYHYVSERNVGTLKELRPELKRLTEQMQSAQQRKQLADRIVENYKEPASLGQLRETIIATYFNINFKNVEPTEDLVVIEERNNQLRPVVNSLLSQDGSFLTLATFNKTYDDFIQKQKVFDEKETELRTLTEKLTALNADEKRLNNQYEFLNNCIAYVRDEQLMKLEGLQSKESEANLKRSKIAFVKELIAGIEINPDTARLGSEEIQSTINELNIRLRSDEAEMAALLTSLGQLEKVISQIKLHGREFLELDPNASECPLCQAHYDRGELELRLMREPLTDSIKPPTSLDTLRQRVEDVKRNIQHHELILQEQKKVIQAFNAAFSDESFSGHIASLERLQRFVEQEDATAREIYELSELKRYAEAEGRSEKEFNELKFAYIQNFNDGPVFATGQAPAFQALLDETIIRINRCKTEIEETVSVRTRVGNEIKRLLDVEGETLNLRNIRELFQKEETSIRNIKNALDKLCDLIELDRNTLVSKISELSETLRNNISSLREEQKIQFEYESARKEQNETSTFFTNNKDRLKRYEQAVNVLRDLTGDEAAAHVSAFFDENFQEIIDIFKSIHEPREFKTLKYVDDRLELITENNEIRSISQISTGQRSALALSIFLSLNMKLDNGPDLVMFDDPIAFIDDLNALSFLDYLRMHTLKSGKQIFFATANMRLAGLFEKKFNFLEDDFKKFSLDRSLNA